MFLSPAMVAELVEVVRRAGRTVSDLRGANRKITITAGSGSDNPTVGAVIRFADGAMLRATMGADGAWTIATRARPTPDAMEFGDRE